MKPQKFLALGAILVGMVAMTSGSTRLAIPLVPVAIYYSVTQHWPYLVGAGLGAAALIKLKSAATVGTYIYLRNKGVVDVSFDSSAAGWDSSVASGYERRHRRSLTVGENDITGISFNPSLDEILAYDELGCGLRLICELASLPDAQLQDDERIILTLFGGEEKLPNPYLATRGKLSYAYASLLGKTSRDTKVCSRVYSHCPHEGKLVMDALREAPN